jgi:flagellar protein FliS
VLLYEQAIQDLQRALAAMEQGHIEQRTREINHALQIIGYLEGTLDLEKGGEVAGNLRHCYERLRANLVAGQIHASARIITQQITDLLALREAWLEVNRKQMQTDPPVSGVVFSRMDGESTITKWTI